MAFSPTQLGRIVPNLSDFWSKLKSKTALVVIFSSLAIALYGYDQGMMSLVNTNHSYLHTMNIRGDSPVVGIIVSIYYIGCMVGAVMASKLADMEGRKIAITACLVTCVIGNILMFIPGIYPWNSDNTWHGGSIILMFIGRIVLGLGVGGIDAVVPIYSSELSKDDTRGSAMAKEFQANIFGLFLAFSLNYLLTKELGKDSQWAWRIPIIFMQIFPVVLFFIIRSLPESPRWLISKQRLDDATDALEGLYGKAQSDIMLEELQTAQEDEGNQAIGYSDMMWGSQSHATMITIMGQINQALTGYGAVSVYGPQIFELLGLSVSQAERTTLGNYLFYFAAMFFAWKQIDVYGRRWLMLYGSLGLTICYGLLAYLGSMSVDNSEESHFWVELSGSVVLYLSTAIFGISWLTTVWLIPTEIYPNGARARGSAISVIVWGIANFLVTLLTPIGFNNMKHWLFLVFAATNMIAGMLTFFFSPETGGRSFEENQTFFTSAREEGTWIVRKVADGKFLNMPQEDQELDNAGGDNVKNETAESELAKGEDATRGDATDGPSETTPLLQSVQVG
ncbi:general substrate transporter [Hypoxylon sp. FL1857]|nr:general substrate transporter [Hypoxylon sp. FL1857]